MWCLLFGFNAPAGTLTAISHGTDANQLNQDLL
jgi:hypothetical protein